MIFASSTDMPYNSICDPRFLGSCCQLLFLFLTAQATLSSSHCTQGPSLKAGSLEPVPLFDTASDFAPVAEQQDATTLAQIANTLSLYPFAIDGKNYARLRNVFFKDAVVNFSAPIGVIVTLPAIEKSLSTALAYVATQHQLGTQVVDLLPGGCKAKSLTYFTASHFGKNKYEGEVLYAYGQYQDMLAKDKDGVWKIQARVLQYMVGTLHPPQRDSVVDDVL